MKKLLSSLGKEHEVGDPNCPDCSFGWPMGCNRCGGRLHNKFIGQTMIFGRTIPISKVECDTCGWTLDESDDQMAIEQKREVLEIDIAWTGARLIGAIEALERSLDAERPGMHASEKTIETLEDLISRVEVFLGYNGL